MVTSFIVGTVAASDMQVCATLVDHALSALAGDVAAWADEAVACGDAGFGPHAFASVSNGCSRSARSASSTALASASVISLLLAMSRPTTSET